MSLLIKGLEMPKEDELLCIRIYPSGKVTVDMDLQCKQVAEAVELPDHEYLIDKNKVIDDLQHGIKYISEMQKDVKDVKSISYCQGVMVGYANSMAALNLANVLIPEKSSEASLCDNCDERSDVGCSWCKRMESSDDGET